MEYVLTDNVSANYIIKNETYSTYGHCRCCLEEGNHRDITKSYIENGKRELYGDIFLDCFNLFLSTNMNLSTLICTSCVDRLRSANEFKQLVMQTEQQLMAALQDCDTDQVVLVNVPVPEETLDTTIGFKIEVNDDDVKPLNLTDKLCDFEDCQVEELLECLTEEEIEFALSDSEIDEIDEEMDGLYEEENGVRNVQSANNEDSSSSESDKDVPLSELVSRPARGRSSIRRGAPSRRRRLRGGRSIRGRGGSRNAVRMGVHGLDTFESDEERKWNETNFTPSVVPYTQPAYIEIDSSKFDKIDYFKQYIDEELVQLIIVKSNQTYVKITGKSLCLTDFEFYVYLGITIVMSTINYPYLRMYWEKKFRVPVIVNNMSRTRFFILRNSIKFVFDDDIGRDVRDADKMWKIRPLLDSILRACRLQPKEESMCIDEMMVPFTGQCLLKQYVPNKPHPTGIKMYVLASPNGIVANFDLYQGSTTYPNYDQSNFGLGEKAVLSLTENLVPGHKLYFDRFFTSEQLAIELKARNLLCTGTVMKNLIPIALRPYLKDDRQMKYKGRGACQMLVNCENNIAVTKWQDNKPIFMLSTAHGIEPADTCSRWSKSSKQYVDVPRPDVIKAYNKNMGGVDLADRMLSVCPNRYRTKKWTQRMFSHMIDMACSNGWLLFKKDRLKEQVPLRKIQKLRAFKLEIGETLIEAYAATSEEEEEIYSEEGNEGKKGRETPTPSVALRKRKASHMPQFSDSQKKCRQCHIMKTTVYCIQCNVFLCFRKDRNCFFAFHS